MEITEARIKLMPSRSDRLQAFCTITIDNDFVIRDIKIIEGVKGAFVAMPSRKLTDKCPKCGGKNHLRARHCNDCGGKLDENRATKDKRGRAKLHADVAHPINSACRERMQEKIIEEYTKEVQRSKEPGYVPTRLYDDEDMDEFDAESHEEEETAATERKPERPEPKPQPEPTATETRPQPEPTATETRPQPEPTETRPQPEPTATETMPQPEPTETETRPQPAPARTEPRPQPAPPRTEPRPQPAPPRAEPKPQPRPEPRAPEPGPDFDDMSKPLAEQLKDLERSQSDDDEEEEDVDEDDTRGNDFAAGIL